MVFSKVCSISSPCLYSIPNSALPTPIPLNCSVLLFPFSLHSSRIPQHSHKWLLTCFQILGIFAFKYLYLNIQSYREFTHERKCAICLSWSGIPQPQWSFLVSSFFIALPICFSLVYGAYFHYLFISWWTHRLFSNAWMLWIKHNKYWWASISVKKT